MVKHSKTFALNDKALTVAIPKNMPKAIVEDQD
jgi:hypothetical protein